MRIRCKYGSVIKLLLSVTILIGSSQAFARKPNVLFILTDDQRYDMLSLYSAFPGLQTPNIDRLAREGALFENAFVTTSLCSPSRASFLTGAYAHRHGVIVNAYKDPAPETPIFPALLQDGGYETAFIGKWHMAESISPRLGFDHWVSFYKQGKYFDNQLNVDGSLKESAAYITDELTDRALQFISRERDKPFALYLSHKAIHASFIPAARHRGLYSDLTFDGFGDPDEDLSDKPQWLLGQLATQREDQAVIAQQRKDMLRTMSAVDESVGRIIQELKDLDILDSTVVVYAGDNGYFFGEHGIPRDKRRAYEPSIRVPLIMRYPPLIEPGTRVSEMVLNIDLAPTLLELAGVAVPPTVQGRSWVGLLQGDKHWRESFLYEYYSEDDYRPIGGSTSTPTILALRTSDWKYITFPELDNERNELYNLEDDPNELTNLAMDPEYSQDLARMRGELDAYLTSIAYVKPKLTPSEQFCAWFTLVCRGGAFVARYFPNGDGDPPQK